MREGKGKHKCWEHDSLQSLFTWIRCVQMLLSPVEVLKPFISPLRVTPTSFYCFPFHWKQYHLPAGSMFNWADTVYYQFPQIVLAIHIVESIQKSKHSCGDVGRWKNRVKPVSTHLLKETMPGSMIYVACSWNPVFRRNKLPALRPKRSFPSRPPREDICNEVNNGLDNILTGRQQWVTELFLMRSLSVADCLMAKQCWQKRNQSARDKVLCSLVYSKVNL